MSQTSSLKSLLNEPYFKPLNVGDVVEGEVIKKEKASVFVRLRNFSTGIIYGREFNQAKEFLKEVQPGDKIFVKIIEIDNEDGYVELSLREAEKELGWEKLKQKKENNATLIIRVLNANKGGLLTEVEGIPAFIPVSQLAPEHYPKVEGGDQEKILRHLKQMIGQELKVKILTLNKKTRSLILSEKATIMERTKELIKNYQVGDIVQGKIVQATDFGAFIKFPFQENDTGLEEEKLEGLIHISELSTKPINNPLEVVKIGDLVKAKIIEIDNGRVFLSLKRVKQDEKK